MFETLKELDALYAIAGSEAEVFEYIKEKAKPYEITQDAIGNIIVFKKGKKERKAPVVLFAHIDEVGFRLQKFEENGTIRFAPVGMPFEPALFGQRVKIGEKKLTGAIYVDDSKRSYTDPKLPKPMDYFIDFGAKDKKQAEALLKIGDAIYMEGDFRTLPNGNLKGRALESRIGAAVLLDFLKEDLEFDTYFAFTTLDSIKARNSCGRGSQVVVSKLNPKAALFVEAREAFDFEALPEYRRQLSLGKGAAIVLGDKGSAYTRPLRKMVEEKAKAYGISYQYPTCFIAVKPTSRTAVCAAESCASMALAAPVRYLHTANAVVNPKDMQSLKDLSRIFMEETEEYDA